MIEQKTYNVVSYKDLNQIVEEEFGPGWNFLTVSETHNDTSHVIDPEWGDDDETVAVQIESFPEISAHNVILALIQRGKIPSGEYLVEVCW